MIAVIFELTPAPGMREAYLESAGRIRPVAEKMDGFISIERFESISQPGKMLALSLWRDEAALTAWRNLPEHRAMQKLGRERYFADYRLRIATVVRDYGMQSRDEAPEDSRATHG